MATRPDTAELRAWQAGDLVQFRGEWRVLTDRAAKTLNQYLLQYPDGKLADAYTLLAAADADLWEALPGLPGCEHLDEHWAEIWLCGYVRAKIARVAGVDRCALSIGDHDWVDIAPLKQAIQRFETLQAYIAAKDGAK